MTFINLNKKLRAHRSEKGETLPGVMIASVIGGIVLFGAGTAILSTLSGSAKLSDTATLTSNATNVNSSLRNDISNATLIKPLSNLSAEFTVPGKEGKCKIVKWENSSTSSAASSINRTVINYPTQAVGADGKTSCSGTAGTPITEPLASNVSSVDYKYSNRVGRSIVVQNGVIAFANPSEAVPSGVPANRWNELTVSGVSVTMASSTASGETTSRTVTQFSAAADNSANVVVPASSAEKGTLVNTPNGANSPVYTPTYTPTLSKMTYDNGYVANLKLQGSTATSTTCGTAQTFNVYAQSTNKIVGSTTSINETAPVSFPYTATSATENYYVMVSCTDAGDTVYTNPTKTAALSVTYNEIPARSATSVPQFTTAAGTAPTATGATSPSQNATGQSRTVRLSWQNATPTAAANSWECWPGTTPRYTITQTKTNGAATSVVKLSNTTATTYTTANNAAGVQAYTVGTSCVVGVKSSPIVVNTQANAIRTYTTS